MKTSKLLMGLAIGTLLYTAQSRAQISPPVIDTQPASQTVASGTDVTFTVGASGSEPLAYQWFLNSIEVSGATSSSLTLVSAQETNAGSYSVLISNEAGTALSEAAILSVTNAPTPAQTFLDFNGDGKADLLWVHPNGQMAAWLMDGTNFLSSFLLPYKAPSGWNIAGEADFDHDGKLDLLWQHQNGTLLVWFMDGTNRLGTVKFTRRPTGGWRVVGLTDFDKDGSSDIVWQTGNGQVAAWLMNGTNVVRSVSLNSEQRMQGGWKIVAVFDLDNNGSADFLWQHGGGKIVVWYMDGTAKLRSEILALSQRTSSSWSVTGNTDLNRDGKNDLVWQTSSRQIAYWLLNGPKKAKVGLLRKGQQVASGWTLENHK